jgi:hypothetical protein
MGHHVIPWGAAPIGHVAEGVSSDSIGRAPVPYRHIAATADLSTRLGARRLTPIIP